MGKGQALSFGTQTLRAGLFVVLSILFLANKPEIP